MTYRDFLERAQKKKTKMMEASRGKGWRFCVMKRYARNEAKYYPDLDAGVIFV